MLLTLLLTLCGLTNMKTHREVADQSTKKPILVSFILLKRPLNTHTWESTPEVDLNRFVHFKSGRITFLYRRIKYAWRPLVLYQVD